MPEREGEPPIANAHGDSSPGESSAPSPLRHTPGSLDGDSSHASRGTKPSEGSICKNLISGAFAPCTFFSHGETGTGQPSGVPTGGRSDSPSRYSGSEVAGDSRRYHPATRGGASRRSGMAPRPANAPPGLACACPPRTGISKLRTRAPGDRSRSANSLNSQMKEAPTGVGRRRRGSAKGEFLPSIW
jgi:hypothetical protein